MQFRENEDKFLRCKGKTKSQGAGFHVFLRSCSKDTVSKNCCLAPALNDVQALTNPEHFLFN